MTDHFADKVPDFKASHLHNERKNPPITTPQENMDEPASMLPRFVPIQVPIPDAHSIAKEASDSTRIPLTNTGMSTVQVDYLTRCIYDAVQQMLMGQDTWEWNWRYAVAVARGETPDPRGDDTPYE